MRRRSLAPHRAARASMGRPWLEAFKFATYLAVPIALTVTFAFDPDNLNRVIRDVRHHRRAFRSSPERRSRRATRKPRTRTSTDEALDDDLGSRRSARTWCTRRRARSRRRVRRSWTRT